MDPGHGGARMLLQHSQGLTLGFIHRRPCVIRCGRKNDHGPARKQAHKQYDQLRRGESRQVLRGWNYQAREAAETLPPDPLRDLGPHPLAPGQAVGQVTSAQANFMTVVVADSSVPRGISGEPCGTIGGLHGAPGEPGETRGTPGEARGEQGRTGVKLLCVVRAVLKKIKRRVMVGDRVVVTGVDWVDRRGMIEEVLERSSETSDPPVANVDLLLVLFSLDRPRLDPMILNRFLIEAESTGISLAVVLNKADLVSPEVKEGWERRLTDWGYKPYTCSVETGMGLGEMAPLLEGKTSVVFGPSGVGKSSLINALRSKTSNLPVDAEAQQEVDDEVIRVNEVSYRTGSGRHTTRHVSLLQLPFKGAMLADTPGFSFPSLLKVTSDSLAQLFPEVRSRLEENDEACAFADCQHISEPGCVVGAKWERYSYYASLWNEVRKREEHEKNMFGTKQEGDMRFKVRASGVKQPEPMLVLKKHRRTSRKQTKQMVDKQAEGAQDDDEEDLDELQNSEAAV